MLGKRISISIILILAIFLLADFALARDLEVPLPAVGENQEVKTTPLLPDYIKYVFNFGIGIAGLVAFGSLVYGGFRYLTSAGNPSSMSDANSQIWAGLIGLLVILGSWLLLTTINPQLIIINPKLGESGLVVTATSGVYLCKNNSLETCLSPSTSDILTLPSGYDDNINYIKFQNSESERYGVVLWEHDKLGEAKQSTCRVYLSSNPNIGENFYQVSVPAGTGKISSATVFMLGTDASGAGVTLYEHKESGGKKITTKTDIISLKNTPVGNKVSSIEIDGHYYGVLFGNDNFEGTCTVYKRSDPYVGDEQIKNDRASSVKVILVK